MNPTPPFDFAQGGVSGRVLYERYRLRRWHYFTKPFIPALLSAGYSGEHNKFSRGLARKYNHSAMRSADSFLRNKLTKILSEKHRVLDIGGGLRVDLRRSNRYTATNQWMQPLIERVEYKILDAVPDYNPDFVGDIHRLPFKDGEWDAVICASVLEHVENPIKAVDEIHRVLKSGGYCFIYIPFLYYYHAEKGYYKDYWRFTKDTIAFLFKKFSKIELQPVRGAIATWLHISPLGKNKWLASLATLLDSLFKKNSSSQVSGYYVFLTK